MSDTFSYAAADDDKARSELQRRRLLASDPAPLPPVSNQPTSVARNQQPQFTPPAQPTYEGQIPAPPPMVPTLRLYNMPAPPQDEYSNPFQVFQNPMVLLAGLGSLLTRQPLTTAMNAAASAMKGFHQGQTDVFEQHKRTFDQNLTAALEQNKLELERYKIAWDRRQELNWRDVYPKLYTEAAKNNDQNMLTALRTGDWSLVEKIIMGREQAQNVAERQMEMMQIRLDLLNQQRGGDTPGQQASNIVDGMQRGDEPPTLTGLGAGMSPLVRNEASKRKFDLAKAQMEWLRAQTHMRSLSGPNITKYFALAESVKNTIDEVTELSKQLNLGRYPAKNRADLVWLVQTKGGTPEGDLAVRYLGAIKTLKEEFANLAQGGGVPTEPAWSLANEQINQDFGVSALNSSLQEVRRLIGFRVKAIQDVAQQPYSPTGQAPAAAPTQAPASGGWKIEPVQ